MEQGDNIVLVKSPAKTTNCVHRVGVLQMNAFRYIYYRGSVCVGVKLRHTPASRIPVPVPHAYKEKKKDALP